jgi:hypothetical protein
MSNVGLETRNLIHDDELSYLVGSDQNLNWVIFVVGRF